MSLEEAERNRLERRGILRNATINRNMNYGYD